MEQFEELRNFLQASKVRKEMPDMSEAHIGNHLRDVFDRMAKQSVGAHNPQMLYSGLTSVDESIGGLECGEMTVINGCGRTVLALHYAIQTAKETKKPVWIYSQTHSVQQITTQLLSMLTYIPEYEIDKARLTDRQWNNLYTAACWLKEQDIRIYDLCTNPRVLCETMEKSETPALLILNGAVDVLMSETGWLLELGRFAKKKQCCVLFTAYDDASMPYICEGADKILSILLLEEDDDVCAVKETWNRYGYSGYCRLRWVPGFLCFMDESLYSEENDNV